MDEWINQSINQAASLMLQKIAQALSSCDNPV
jgi:hypothetical protein